MEQENEKIKYYKKIGIKILILAGILLGIFDSYQVAIFYLPFLIALFIATLLEPIIRFFMKKWKWKRGMASIVTLILIVVLLGGVLTLVISKAISESTSLLANLNVYFGDTYTWAMGLISDLQEGKLQIPAEVVSLVQNSLDGILNTVKVLVTEVLTSLVNTASAVPSTITYTFITILAIIFTCMDRDYVIKQIQRQIPKKWLEHVNVIVKETFSVSWNYIKAEAKLSLGCFVLMLIGLTLINLFGINVGYPVTMAIFIGFVDLLPLFGAGAVMIPWAIWSLLTGNVPLAIAIMVLWGIWAIIKNLAEPKVVSKQMGLHPILTLFGMYTGFKLIGVLGLLLGPIILIIIKNIFREMIQKGVLKTFFELD